MEEPLNRVISIAAEGTRFAWGLEGQQQRLKEYLTMILAVYQYAARKAVKDRSVNLCLERLKVVAYDIEDVLDEFAYEISRKHAYEISRKHQKKGKIRDFFSLQNLIAFRLSMDRKFEKIEETLDEILGDAVGSGLGLTFLQHEDRAQESAVDTVETEKLNGAMEMEIQSCYTGVESEQGRPDRSLLEVIGDGVGAVRPANSPRQMIGYAKLGSQPEGMDDAMQDGSDQQNEQLLQTPGSPSTHRVRPSNQSAMEMEPGTNTRSNPSQENAESSCKSKTAEWALLLASLVLEAISAIFDQLGYALPSMVMAFLALFLSILDLIHKAREKGITYDGRSLLPCFYRHSSHDFQNRKPFASLVQYFGLAGALWQCSFTTVGYYYTHHKLVNPIKLCLLPFILALCVLISKVVKSSQHEM